MQHTSSPHDVDLMPRDLLEVMDQGAALIDRDGKLLYANPALLERCGAESSLLGQPLRTLVDGADLLIDGLFATPAQRSQKGNCELRNANGQRQPVQLTVTRLQSSERKEELLFALLSDPPRPLADELKRETDALFEQSGEAMLVCDGDGIVVRANREARQLFGDHAESQLVTELLRFNPFESSSTDDRAELEQRLYALIGERKSFRGVRLSLLGTAEQPLHFTLSGTPLKSEREVIGCMLILTAVTALQERGRALRTLIDTIPDLVWLKDPEGIYLACNPAFERFFGATESEIVGRTDFEFVPTELAEFFRRHDRQAIEAGSPSRNEEWVDYPDGHRVLLHTTKTPIRDTNGHLIGVLGIGHDITELRRTQQALIESESRYRLALEMTQSGAWEYSLESDQLICSDELVAMMGLERGEFGGALSELESLIHPDDPISWQQEIRTAITSGKRHAFEFRLLRSDGRTRWIELLGDADRDEQGNALRMYGLMRDITEQKEVSKRLRTHERTVSSLFRAAPIGIGLTVERVFKEVNDTFCQMTGYRREELLGQTARMLYPDQAEFERVGREKYAQLEATGRGSVETRLRHQSGRLVDVLISSTWLDPQDRLAGVTFTVVDISAQKRAREEQNRLQRQLQRAQKMEALGQLTGGIAHDFNNVLAAMLGFTELARDRLEELPAAKIGEYLDTVLEAGGRGRDLVSQMLTFSRSEPQGSLAPLDLAPLVKEVAKLLRPVLPSSINITAKVEPHTAATLADPVQIHQILMNLAVNARDSMPERGKLGIQLGTTHLAGEECSACHQLIEGEWVEIVVSDSGCGIPEENIERIFEPFFTTKEHGKGTGLGLSVVTGIVHQHGGHILVHSEAGKGSEFKLLFPPVPHSESAESVTPERRQRVRGEGEQILVVDDEPAIVKFLTELLEMHGYQVTAENDSRRARELITHDAARFDLLLTDQTMPEVSGLDLIATLKSIAPKIPAILCSGYSKALDGEMRERLGIDGYLNKPLAIGALLELTAKLLHERGKP